MDSRDASGKAGAGLQAPVCVAAAALAMWRANARQPLPCPSKLRVSLSQTGIQRRSAASGPPTPLPFPSRRQRAPMVNKGTLWFLGITGATALGIWIIHEQQTEERQVRRCAVALAAAPGCLPHDVHFLLMPWQRSYAREPAGSARRRCRLPPLPAPLRTVGPPARATHTSPRPSLPWPRSGCTRESREMSRCTK